MAGVNFLIVVVFVFLPLSLVKSTTAPKYTSSSGVAPLAGNLFAQVNVQHISQRSTVAVDECWNCAFGYVVYLANQTRSPEVQLSGVGCGISYSMDGGVYMPNKELYLFTPSTGTTGSRYWSSLNTKTYKLSCLTNNFPYDVRQFVYDSDLNRIFAHTYAYNAPSQIISIDPVTWKTAVVSSYSTNISTNTMVYNQETKIIYTGGCSSYSEKSIYYLHSIDVQPPHTLTTYTLTTKNADFGPQWSFYLFFDPTTNNLMAVGQDGGISVYSITLDSVLMTGLATPVGPATATNFISTSGDVFFPVPGYPIGYMLNIPHFLKFDLSAKHPVVEVETWPALDFPASAMWLSGTIYYPDP